MKYIYVLLFTLLYNTPVFAQVSSLEFYISDNNESYNNQNSINLLKDSDLFIFYHIYTDNGIEDLQSFTLSYSEWFKPKYLEVPEYCKESNSLLICQVSGSTITDIVVEIGKNIKYSQISAIVNYGIYTKEVVTFIEYSDIRYLNDGKKLQIENKGNFTDMVWIGNELITLEPYIQYSKDISKLNDVTIKDIDGVTIYSWVRREKESIKNLSKSSSNSHSFSASAVASKSIKSENITPDLLPSESVLGVKQNLGTMPKREGVSIFPIGIIIFCVVVLYVLWLKRMY